MDKHSFQLLGDRISDPCIRNCCLDMNDVCQGCYRHLSEITAWQDMSKEQRLDVLAMCDLRKQHRFSKYSPF